MDIPTYGCDNNMIFLVGTIEDELQYTHQIYGEGFYAFHLSVERLSGYKDILTVTVSERLLTDLKLHPQDAVVVEGQIRSYNKYIDGASRLIITAFARNIRLKGPQERFSNPNQVFLDGFICKQPIYRVTPLKREIADILLAVNRAYNKSDYIPCIAWGRNARYCSNLAIGAHLKVWGRMQSREYQKHVDEKIITKVAYEMSITKLEQVK